MLYRTLRYPIFFLSLYRAFRRIWGFGLPGGPAKKKVKKNFFPRLVVRALVNHPYGGDLGPELKSWKVRGWEGEPQAAGSVRLLISNLSTSIKEAAVMHPKVPGEATVRNISKK